MMLSNLMISLVGLYFDLVQFFSDPYSSILELEYLSCSIVCWKYTIYFFVFTEVQSQLRVCLCLRQGIGLILFNITGTGLLRLW